MAMPGKPQRDISQVKIEHERRQNEKRFQDAENALVLLLDAVESLAVDERRKKKLGDMREYLQQRLHRPRP